MSMFSIDLKQNIPAVSILYYIICFWLLFGLRRSYRESMLQQSTKISFVNTSLRASLSSSLFDCYFFFNASLLLAISHEFSFGFSSGPFPGQSGLVFHIGPAKEILNDLWTLVWGRNMDKHYALMNVPASPAVVPHILNHSLMSLETSVWVQLFQS